MSNSKKIDPRDAAWKPLMWILFTALVLTASALALLLHMAMNSSCV